MEILRRFVGSSVNRDLLHRISALVLLALAACKSPTDESRTAYEASARVSGDTVFFDLTVTNRQESDLTLSTDSCRLLGPMLRVYDSGGALRFDEVQRPLTACFLPLFPGRTIAPMESYVFSRGLTTDAILADSLPSGTYTLTVGVEFKEDFTGRPELPVGEFYLPATPAGGRTTF